MITSSSLRVIEDLGSSYWNTQRVSAIMTALKCATRPAVRSTVACALRFVNNKALQPHVNALVLVARLQSSSTAARARALEALMHVDHAVLQCHASSFLSLLDDEHQEVRVRAARAVERLDVTLVPGALP